MKRRRVLGLPNYALAVPAGSEVKLQRMINQLRNAAETSDERQRLLDETYAGRREAVLKGATLKELLNDYPHLFDDGEVSQLEQGSS